jgi:hypothetical protein
MADEPYLRNRLAFHWEIRMELGAKDRTKHTIAVHKAILVRCNWRPREKLKRSGASSHLRRSV